jgi:hypothetical protein
MMGNFQINSEANFLMFVTFFVPIIGLWSCTIGQPVSSRTVTSSLATVVFLLYLSSNYLAKVGKCQALPHFAVLLESDYSNDIQK